MTHKKLQHETRRLLQLFDTPLITPSHQQHLKKRAEKDFFFFFKTYLPHYAEQRFAPFQREIIDLITHSQKFIAIAAPRGFAKSTLVSFAYVIWCIIFKKFFFIVIISATDDLADDLSNFIRMEFQDNPLIKRDFGSLMKHKGAKGDFLIGKTRVLARGRKQANRGFRNREHRPDLIIIDDIEKDEEAISLDSVTKTLDVIHRALIPSLKPQGKLIAIGTILRANSAFAKLIASDEKFWDKKTFKALSWVGSQEKSLWEARFKTPFLLNQRELLGLSVFNAEYQNTPTNSETHIFHESHLRTGHVIEKTIVGFIDPSIDGVKNGDYKACVFIQGSSEGIAIIDIIAKKGSDQEFFEAIYQSYKRFQSHLVSIGIESNGFQKYFVKDMERYLFDKYQLSLPIKPTKQYLKKEYRIHKLLSWFEPQKLVIDPLLLQAKEGQLLTEQLLYFPEKKVHDDIPDALSGAIDLLISLEKRVSQPSSELITQIPIRKKSSFQKIF
ncbi:MAG: hypothetical protein ACRCS8_02055 [Brevinema sp.]